jgi:hypothetical protein
MRQSEVIYKRAKKIANSPLLIRNNIKAPKGFSISYVKYRIMRPLLKIYYNLYLILNPGTPWTTPASIKFFKKCLNQEMVGLEYGSGSSTIFFARRLKHLVSVEHNRSWFKYIKDKASKLYITNLDYQFIPTNNPEITKEIPADYINLNIQDKRIKYLKQYHNYSQFVLKFPDNYFDFIIIDGRARVQCTVNSVNKLKPGGIFVLDNSERGHYKPVHELLKDWKKVNTTTGLFDSTIWIKPSAE